jgi:predicted acylesterase/phospholipase RssA
MIRTAFTGKAAVVVVFVSLIAGSALLAGCGATRPALSKEELADRRLAQIEQIRTDFVSLSAKVVRRLDAEERAYEEAIARGETATPPVLDVLAISGGGDWGAFGAGVLQGWREVKGELALPAFDVVTGVSTGALIAPFAFLGDDASLAVVDDLYRSPKSDWVVLKDWFVFLPWRESFTDTSGLRLELEKNLTRERIARIAEESKKDRAIVIGATNLDLGLPRAWVLGREAEHAEARGGVKRVHDILMASAAIPGIFPPVLIDDTLYVDGGTTANVLLGANLRSEQSVLGAWRRTFPGRKLPRLRFWAIINNTLGDAPSIVRPNWPDVMRKSLVTLTRSATKSSLRSFFTQAELLRRAEGVDIEVRFIAVPNDFVPPVEGSFKSETMNALADIGKRLGRDPANWRTDLVEFEEPVLTLEGNEEEEKKASEKAPKQQEPAAPAPVQR